MTAKGYKKDKLYPTSVTIADAGSSPVSDTLNDTHLRKHSVSDLVQPTRLLARRDLPALPRCPAADSCGSLHFQLAKVRERLRFEVVGGFFSPKTAYGRL